MDEVVKIIAFFLLRIMNKTRMQAVYELYHYHIIHKLLTWKSLLANPNNNMHLRSILLVTENINKMNVDSKCAGSSAITPER